MTLKTQFQTVDVPEDLPADKRLRLAVALFDARLLSNGQAAQMAGLTRADFLDALGQFGVTPFQHDSVQDLAAELTAEEQAQAALRARVKEARGKFAHISGGSYAFMQDKASEKSLEG